MGEGRWNGLGRNGLRSKGFQKRCVALLLLACLLLCEGAMAASRPRATPEPIIAPIPTLIPSEPPPDLGTTPPELLPDTTPTPRNWIASGPVSFDADLLTLEQRADIIRQLQHSIMRTSMADYQLVSGLETTRERPVFIGQSARFRQTFYGVHSNEFMVTMTLTQIIRGAQADAIVMPLLSQITSKDNVLSANMEFVVCIFDIAVTTDDNEQQTFFSIYDFESVSENGRAIQSPILLADEDLTLFLGPGSGSGPLTVILVVEKNKNTTVLYQKKVWFSLMEPPQ